VVDERQQVARAAGVQELGANRNAAGLDPVELVDGHGVRLSGRIVGPHVEHPR
jgi:hypothetical protein